MPQPLDSKKVRKLTPRQYLGEGYFHFFKNDQTGEIVSLETTKKQYESMGIVGGSKNNPVLEGHTWLYSDGGTTKVDTPSGFLGENEYTIQNGKVALCIDRMEKFLPMDAVDSEHNLDESKLEKK